MMWLSTQMSWEPSTYASLQRGAANWRCCYMFQQVGNKATILCSMCGQILTINFLQLSGIYNKYNKKNYQQSDNIFMSSLCSRWTRRDSAREAIPFGWNPEGRHAPGHRIRTKSDKRDQERTESQPFFRKGWEKNHEGAWPQEVSEKFRTY